MGPEAVLMLAIIAAEPALVEQQELASALSQHTRIDRIADEWTKRNTTAWQRRRIGELAGIAQVVVERKVIFRVSF